MVNMTECVNMLRRRIGDTEEPYAFTEELLTGYVEDAVIQVETDYAAGYSVEFGFFTDDIPLPNANLFVVKAHYLFALRTKGKADRDNFRMVKGRLTLDNTNQAADHAETIRFLDEEYKKTLYRVKSGGSSIKGVRVE